MVVKKLNHNASERDRRKKINSLYSSLRSLLPKSDQTTKLSIPSTITRVLQYISELQQEVEGLDKKKEELLMRISQRDVVVIKESQRKIAIYNSFSAVSTNRLNDSEAVIQISSYINVHNTPLSEVLLCLEKMGLSCRMLLPLKPLVGESSITCISRCLINNYLVSPVTYNVTSFVEKMKQKIVELKSTYARLRGK